MSVAPIVGAPRLTHAHSHGPIQHHTSTPAGSSHPTALHPLSQSHTLPLPHPLAQSHSSPALGGHAHVNGSLHGVVAGAGMPHANGSHGSGMSGNAQAGPSRLGASQQRLLHTRDIDSIKRELHDALGEAGLPYWKALNGYLMGQVGRDELATLVRGWLKRNVALHDRLLAALLRNASHPIPTQASSPIRKRRRGADVVDNDPDYVQSRSRAHGWAMGLGAKERARVRRIMAREAEEGEGENEVPKTGWPYAQSARHLPSSHQLAARLTQMAKAYDLDVPADAAAELGELLALGTDAHVADILHGLVRVTARGRPNVDTIAAPKHAHEHANGDHEGAPDGPHDADSTSRGVPKPSLRTMAALFELAPGVHPQASPTLFKLATGWTEAECIAASGEDRKPAVSDAAAADGAEPPPKDREALAEVLIAKGLLKLDKAGRDGEDGDGKKKGAKHGSHWRYEDPAIILRDVLG